MKKITALILALVMTLSLLPMSVWAEGEAQLYWRYHAGEAWRNETMHATYGGSDILYLAADSSGAKLQDWNVSASSAAIGNFSKTDEGFLYWDHSAVKSNAKGTITIHSGEATYTIPVEVGAPEIMVYTTKTGDVFSGEKFADADSNFTYTSGSEVTFYFVARDESITITGYDRIPNEWISFDINDGKVLTLTIPANAYGRQEIQVFYTHSWMEGSEQRSNDGDRFFVFRDTNDNCELFWNYNPEYDGWRNERLSAPCGGSSVIHLGMDAAGTPLAEGWTASVSSTDIGVVSKTEDGCLYWNHSEAVIGARGTITIGSGTDSYAIPVGIEAPQIWVYNSKTGDTYSNPQFADADNNYVYTSGSDVTIYFVAREDITIKKVSGSANAVIGDGGKTATVTISANEYGQQDIWVEYEGQGWGDNRPFWFRDTNDTSELFWSYNPEYDGWRNERLHTTFGGSDWLNLATDNKGTALTGTDWTATATSGIGTVEMSADGRLVWDHSQVRSSTSGAITVSNGTISYKIPVAIEPPEIFVFNTKTAEGYDDVQFADADYSFTYTSGDEAEIYFVARDESITITGFEDIDNSWVSIADDGSSATLVFPAEEYGRHDFRVIFEQKRGDWTDRRDMYFWFRDTNDEGTIFYRHHESDPWHNWRMEEPVGGNSRIFLALDEEGTLLDISTPWTASASEDIGKVIVFGDILYWDRSQALPGATGTITITNGTDTYRLPVSIGVPWMLMFEGEISPEKLVNPDENDRYYYPTDEDKKNTVVFVPSADYVTIDSVDAPSDIDVRIAEDKKSVTVTIPEGRHGEFHLMFNFTETFGEEQHKNYRSLWVRDDGAKAKLTTGKLIKESDYIQWESKDEIFHVNENVPVPFTLSIDGKEQTFYMLPAMINEGVLSSAWLNWCGIATWSNEGGLYYAVDYWTSDNGGKDLAPISDELRGKINAMVESASITIAPVAGYEGNVGTRYPSSARGDDIPRNIRETFGNRLAAVGYCHNLDTLGMWQVKTTVKFKNGLELTTALSSKSEYLAVYDHPMEADATVADINAYIASFKENYPNANPQQSTLNLSLPGKELHGLIVVDPETAPKEIQLMGCEGGVGETVLYGSVYANNFSTRLMNIRMVGAGKTNNKYKEAWNSDCADELIGTPNYGVYGSAYGYIHCCSFTGYRTAVYSKADWYRFGMGYSLFYDNHTALYMECTDPNGGGVPTMAGNVYMNNQFALWLERFPTNFDTSTFGTDDNIFIDNQKDIHSGNRSYFAPGNAFGTLTSNGNKAVPNTTGKAHAAPYYGVTDTGLAVLSGNLSQLPLDTLSQELSTWIDDVKLYPNNWAVPNYGDAEIYMISVDDITDGMTISTIDKTSDSDNDVLGTIKLKKNK